MTGKTILTVDQDPAIVELLKTILEGEGYKGIAAQSPTEALKLLAKWHFDLVITEVFDQRDKFELDVRFIARLRSVADGTPIILLSTSVLGSGMRDGQYDLAAAIPKPFDIDKLVETVDKVLGR